MRTWAILFGLVAVLAACEDPCDTPANRQILAQAAKEEGAVITESGLVFRSLKAGLGPTPRSGDRVTVHYEGKLADGTVFDSSLERGRTASFKLTNVIAGWTEGLQLVKGGGKAKLTIPPKLGYGDSQKSAKIPPCSVLTFEIELLGISE